MWKRILEPLRKKLKGENGVRLVMLLGIAGLALILLSGFLPDKAESRQMPHLCRAQRQPLRNRRSSTAAGWNSSWSMCWNRSRAWAAVG